MVELYSCRVNGCDGKLHPLRNYLAAPRSPGKGWSGAWQCDQDRAHLAIAVDELGAYPSISIVNEAKEMKG